MPRAYWRRDHGEISASHPGDLLGSGEVWPVGRRTRGRRLMAQQKSEDRVVPEGGVMPAERAGSSTGGQGKAVPVEETAVQLSLLIATAENPQGATRRRSRDRLGEIRAGAPKAIDKAGMASSATMEEVAYRLTNALLKVASNKGAPVRTGRRSRRCLSSGRPCCPGCKPTCWREGIGRRDPPGVHSQGGRWGARTGDSRRGR